MRHLLRSVGLVVALAGCGSSSFAAEVSVADAVQSYLFNSQLVERADGAAFEPWSGSVELSAVRDMQPRHSVAMPLPAPGLYRATCREGRYKPTEVWVPAVDHPRVAIVLEPSDSAGSGR